MDATPPAINPEPSSPQEPVSPPMSLSARLLNIFAVPGDVFDDIREIPCRVSNWLLPVIISSIIGVIAALIMFSQPAIQQEIKEQQVKAIEKQVEAGKMTRQQADQALEVMQKFAGPTLLKIAGSVGAVVYSVVKVFGWAFILWIIAQLFLKQKTSYLKWAEVAGLALMIAVLGQIVTLLLTVNLARLIATPSLGLLVENFDVNRKSHLLLGAVNVFNLWYVGVIASGFSRIMRIPFIRGFTLVFAYWVLLELLLIAIGAGQMAL
jgi:hypothetical protein